MNTYITNPPFKRIRVGRQLKAKMTRAINASASRGAKGNAQLGELFKSLRMDLGKTPRYKLADMLEMTEQTLQKLETAPQKSGIQPTLKLLQAFGLTLAIEHPNLDQSAGYISLAKAFTAVRNRNAHLNQRDLSLASGVARTTIQNVEAGKPVKVATLIQLLSVMGARLAIVSMDELTLMEEPAQPAESTNDEVNSRTEEPVVLDRYAPSLADMLTREPISVRKDAAWERGPVTTGRNAA